MGIIEDHHPTYAADSDHGGVDEKQFVPAMFSDIWSRECAGPVFEQGPGMGAGAQWLAPPSVSACACVSSVSRRVACGVSPCGVRTLAVWPLDSRRVAFPHLCTLGWGSGETRVEWSAIYPVPAPQPVTGAPMVPYGG